MKIRMPLAWRVLGMCMARDAMFFVPVAIAYYQMKGADLAGFLLLQGLFRAAVVVLEIPTGFLADRWQRHQQLLASSLLWLISLAVLYASTTMVGLLVAELIGAVAITTRSGTVEAYLYEATGRGNKRLASLWQARLFASSLVMETVTSLSGAWLFTQWVEGPVIASLVLALVAVGLALSLPKLPQNRGPRRHANVLRDLYLVVRWSLHEHHRLPQLLMGPPLLMGFTGLLFWSMQAQLLSLGVSVLGVGLALSSYFMLKALAALATDRLLARVGEQRLAALLVMLLVAGALLIALHPSVWLVWLGGVLGPGLVHALGRPFLICLINEEVEDGERATVLSVSSWMQTCVGAVLMMGVNPLLNSGAALPGILLGYLGLVMLLAAYPFYKLIRG